MRPLLKATPNSAHELELSRGFLTAQSNPYTEKKSNHCLKITSLTGGGHTPQGQIGVLH